ncbi:MAG: CDP-alcohol phosphatidyltransferase family protein [Bacilli bacterium]|nr:CDP-alcohol phosphatidyltransferase family protein [Bacilli bacterium]
MNRMLKIGIVNFITTIRFVGILLLVPAFFCFGGFVLALINIFCFLTDFLDGFLARKWHASTFFGSLYDGLSDKFFLVANLFILVMITPWVWFLVGFEVAILGVQWIKYHYNMNVQTNFIGKIKMWVAGFTIVLSNFLIDIEKLSFLSPALIEKVAAVSEARLVLLVLLPLFFAEVITLISYLKELRYLKLKINDFAMSDEIDNLPTFKEMLFSHAFYEKHKNESGLRLLQLRAKKRD